MTFNNDKAIYIQIAERLSDEILADQIQKTRKREFLKERLPEMARQMSLLGISLDEVSDELASLLNR